MTSPGSGEHPLPGIARHLFAGADEVEGVDENLVRLSVPRRHLVREN